MLFVQFFVILFLHLYLINTQDYQLMYEPLIPSGMRNAFNYQPIAVPPVIETPQYQKTLMQYLGGLNPEVTKPNFPQTAIKTPTAVAETTNVENHKILPGLEGTECTDLYKECPEYAENKYCTKYRQQMLFQCRKTCGFCDIDPYKSKHTADDDDSSGDDDDNSGTSGDDDSSGNDDKNLNENNEKRSSIETPDTDADSWKKDSAEYIDENDKHFYTLKARFKMPGLTPSLEDLYAEIGTLNPGADKAKQILKSESTKRSTISKNKKDPFKYLKNPIPGSSINHIVDISSLSASKVLRSNPVYVMKNPSAAYSSKYKRHLILSNSNNEMVREVGRNVKGSLSSM